MANIIKIVLCLIAILHVHSCRDEKCDNIDYFPNGRLKMKRCETKSLSCFSFYYENGEKKSSFCLKKILGDTILQGLFIRYFPNGNIEFREKYNLGKKDGKQEYYDKRKRLVRIENYSHGKKEGIFESYDSMGNISARQFFIDDEFYYKMGFSHQNDSIFQYESFAPRVHLMQDTLKFMKDTLIGFLDLPIPDSLFLQKKLSLCYSKKFIDFENNEYVDFDRDVICSELYGDEKIELREYPIDTGLHILTFFIEEKSSPSGKRLIHNPIVKRVYVIE